MQALFTVEPEPGGTAKSTVLSACGLYRYKLGRTWNPSVRPAAFVMLNPSVADAERDDPTIRRCIGFARSWGCGGIVVVNLFALRATDPLDLYCAADAIGPDNDRHILEAVRDCSAIVAAWGVHGAFRDREADVRRLLADAELAVPVVCLGKTQAGFPRHPLYVKADAALIPLA